MDARIGPSLSVLLLLPLCVLACMSAGAGGREPLKAEGAKEYAVRKTEAEWKQQLTPEQVHVLREKGTERAFTGKYWKTKDAGTYHCAACG
jgi:peptide-methionine (R)-S-oxide reductase